MNTGATAHETGRQPSGTTAEKISKYYKYLLSTYTSAADDEFVVIVSLYDPTTERTTTATREGLRRMRRTDLFTYFVFFAH